MTLQVDAPSLELRKAKLIEYIQAVEKEEDLVPFEQATKGRLLVSLPFDLSSHPNIKKGFDIEEIIRNRPEPRLTMEQIEELKRKIVWDTTMEEDLAKMGE